MSYTTLADVKLHLGISGAEQDDLLTALIEEAEAAIDDYCRTTFAVTTDSTRTFDPTCDVDGSTLYLDRHLAAITSLVNGDGVTIAAADYVTKPANEAPYYAVTLKSNGSLTWTYTDAHEQAIAVTGKWGYSTTVPPAVGHVAQRLVDLAYNSQGQAGIAKMDVEDLSVTMKGGQEAIGDILTSLQPYRRL